MLKLDSLLPQVNALTAHVRHKAGQRAAQLDLALERLHTYASDLAALQRKATLIRERSLPWRGAVPRDEPLDIRVGLPDLPVTFTLVANDGSQVPVDRHAVALYYLINIGAVIYRGGSATAPETQVDSRLYFADDDLLEGGQPVMAATVNARRTLAEITALADAVEVQAAPGVPLVALMDGPLLWSQKREGTNPHQQKQALDRYLFNFDRLQRAGAVVGGYVDRPGSTAVNALLHLAVLDDTELNAEALDRNDLDGLPDRHIFARLLGPGERSAVFVRELPTNNKVYRQAGHEIWFCYVNVAVEPGPRQANVVRLDFPEWVARDPHARDLLHAVVCQQARILDGFPYVLARAHELALISSEERHQMDTLIAGQLLAAGIEARPSHKARQKALTAGARRRGR